MGVPRVATGKNLLRGCFFICCLIFVSKIKLLNFFFFFSSCSIFGFKGLHTPQVYWLHFYKPRPVKMPFQLILWYGIFPSWQPKRTELLRTPKMASTCLAYSWKVVHGTVKQEILLMRRQCNWCRTCPLFISNHTKVKRRQRICTNAPATCTPFEQVQEKGIHLWLPLIWKLANTTVNFGRKEGRRACCRPVIKKVIKSGEGV